MNNMSCRDPQMHATGFSLLEVLISLVILSVGLLGIAGLTSTTLKSNDSAYMRTQATVQAYNIIDRMRANMPGATNGSYNLGMPAAAATANSTACTTGTCDSAALATYDLDQWEYELAQRLPQGRGSITTAPASSTFQGVTVTIRVLWNDSRATQALAGATSAPVATTFSLSVSSVL